MVTSARSAQIAFLVGVCLAGCGRLGYEAETRLDVAGGRDASIERPWLNVAGDGREAGGVDARQSLVVDAGAQVPAGVTCQGALSECLMLVKRLHEELDTLGERCAMEMQIDCGSPGSAEACRSSIESCRGRLQLKGRTNAQESNACQGTAQATCRALANPPTASVGLCASMLSNCLNDDAKGRQGVDGQTLQCLANSQGICASGNVRGCLDTLGFCERARQDNARLSNGSLAMCRSFAAPSCPPS